MKFLTNRLPLFLLILALQTSLPQAEAARGRGKIKLVFSVDWEGSYLGEDNLAAITAFRNRHPEVKIIQFLNASYFTQRGANARAVKAAIDQRLRPGDELGLHIHAWKSLFTAAGVSFKDSPNFWGNDYLSPSCDEDCGHEVPINAYTTSELRKVIRLSVSILQSHGYGRARSFRSGGWLGSPNVLEALAAEGFRLDSSAVPPQLLADGLGSFPLFDWIRQLWANVTPVTQPFTIATRAGAILELPDTGGLADYVHSSDMVRVFQSVAEDLARSPDQDRILQFGFHEESAARYLPEMEKGLNSILAKARRNEIPVEMAELPFQY